MVKLLYGILRLFPWLLSLGLLSWIYFQQAKSSSSATQETIQSTLLTRIEHIGKIELVKYNFQEVTEVKRIAASMDFKILKIKTIPDSKAVLISQGSAVGCIDLTKMSEESVQHRNDTVYIRLPNPEICYFKIDLEKSRLYDLQISYLSEDDRKAFIQELYKAAEKDIKISATRTGILEQTKENAHVLLGPLFEGITQQPVVISFDLPDMALEPDQ